VASLVIDWIVSDYTDTCQSGKWQFLIGWGRIEGAK
jgi:hypothetical protein